MLFERYHVVVIAVVRDKKNFGISVWKTGLEVLVYERRISESFKNLIQAMGVS